MPHKTLPAPRATNNLTGTLCHEKPASAGYSALPALAGAALLALGWVWLRLWDVIIFYTSSGSLYMEAFAILPWEIPGLSMKEIDFTNKYGPKWVLTYNPSDKEEKWGELTHRTKWDEPPSIVSQQELWFHGISQD